MKPKKVVLYSPRGRPVGDDAAVPLAEYFLTIAEEPVFHTSSEVFVNAIRLAVHRGRYPHDRVVFVHRDKVLRLDKNGRIEVWPFGFCTAVSDVLMALLTPPAKKS